MCPITYTEIRLLVRVFFYYYLILVKVNYNLYGIEIALSSDKNCDELNKNSVIRRFYVTLITICNFYCFHVFG